MVWNILVILSLVLNIYCIINIFMAADAAKAQLVLNQILTNHICELKTDIEILRKEVEELKQTMSGGDNNNDS